MAVGEDGSQVSSEYEEPPRTLSSESVQSVGDHGLDLGLVERSAKGLDHLLVTSKKEYL
jgi:hypothetical protein